MVISTSKHTVKEQNWYFSSAFWPFCSYSNKAISWIKRWWHMQSKWEDCHFFLLWRALIQLFSFCIVSPNSSIFCFRCFFFYTYTVQIPLWENVWWWIYGEFKKLEVFILSACTSHYDIPNEFHTREWQKFDSQLPVH